MAVLAVERFLFVVRIHVKGQIVDLVKGLRAYATLVWFDLRVRQKVILVVTLLVKSLAANSAGERLVPRVYPHMCIKGGRPVKRLPAFFAFMRALLCVDNFVAA